MTGRNPEKDLICLFPLQKLGSKLSGFMPMPELKMHRNCIGDE